MTFFVTPLEILNLFQDLFQNQIPKQACLPARQVRSDKEGRQETENGGKEAEKRSKKQTKECQISNKNQIEKKKGGVARPCSVSVRFLFKHVGERGPKRKNI
jgi:hypothetical protein